MSRADGNHDMREEDEDMDDVDMDVVVSDEEIDEDDDDDDEDEMHEVPAPEPVEEDAAIARRRAIQAIMRDTTLSEADKRMQIQNLMSGGRTTVAPPPSPLLPSQAAAASGSNEANAACVHYERNCNIIAPCCQLIYGCRICHDELSPATHPDMNRFLVREVVCKNCHSRQPVSNQCVTCKTVFGEYHCGICNLWMSTVRICCCMLCQCCRLRIAHNIRLVFVHVAVEKAFSLRTMRFLSRGWCRSLSALR
jgi:CHY zinc finger